MRLLLWVLQLWVLVPEMLLRSAAVKQPCTEPSALVAADTLLDALSGHAAVITQAWLSGLLGWQVQEGPALLCRQACCTVSSLKWQGRF